MVKRLLHRYVAAFERHYSYDMRYAHALLDARTRAFLHVVPVSWMSAYRDCVPVPAWFAVKLTTILHEDCGPCTQLNVRMAEEAGLAPETLRAILERDMGKLDADTTLGLAFASAVATRAADADALRAEVVARWGERGLATLALSIAATRVYPALKYALGHGHACGLVTVGANDTPVQPVRLPQPWAAEPQ